jgi:hypothetical protein
MRHSLLKFLGSSPFIFYLSSEHQIYAFKLKLPILQVWEFLLHYFFHNSLQFSMITFFIERFSVLEISTHYLQYLLLVLYPRLLSFLTISYSDVLLFMDVIWAIFLSTDSNYSTVYFTD